MYDPPDCVREKLHPVSSSAKSCKHVRETVGASMKKKKKRLIHCIAFGLPRKSRDACLIIDHNLAFSFSPLFYSLLGMTSCAANLHDNTGVGGDTGPKLSSLLSNGTSDGRSLHLTLGVDNDTGVVLEVEEDAVCAPPGLGLADDDGGHDLLPELRLSLLDSGHDHVTDTTGGETVEAGTNSLDGDDVQVAGSRVVGAVHDGSNWKTEGHPQLVAGSATASARHFD